MREDFGNYASSFQRIKVTIQPLLLLWLQADGGLLDGRLVQNLQLVVVLRIVQVANVILGGRNMALKWQQALQ